MTKRLAGKNKMPKSTYEKCSDCGLKIRCRNVEKHEAGLHHRRKR